MTFLGQNVNSYHDKAVGSDASHGAVLCETTPGFANLYRSRDGNGWRFVDMLDQVALY